MLELMFVFFYIGAFTIGGGMVAIPLVQQQVVERGWISQADFWGMVAVAESTPGPIGINIATYVGYDQFGIIGALLATTSFVLPSFMIVSFLAGLLIKYRTSKLVINWFLYIKAAIVGLIGLALVNLVIYVFFEEGVDIEAIDIKTLILLEVMVLVYYLFRKKPWIAIVLGGVCGAIFL